MSLQTLIGLPVDAPPLAPSPVGLVRYADVIDVGSVDEHWIAGIAWSPEGNDPYGYVELCTAAMSVSGMDRVANREYLPFWVVTHDKCGAFAAQSLDSRGRARRHLAAIESHAVEEQFERGTLSASAPATYRLIDSDAVTKTLAGGTAQTPERALAILDLAIADAKIGQGMIHASPMTGQLWYSAQALTADNRGRWMTAGGNVVVIGQGYWGQGPGGVDGQNGDATTVATAEWAYATDLVRLFRGDVVDVPDNVTGALDRSLNTIEFWAARPWAIQWSRLLHAAVKVTV